MKLEKLVNYETFCENCKQPYGGNFLYTGNNGRAAYQKARSHFKKTGHRVVYRVSKETVFIRDNTV